MMRAVALLCSVLLLLVVGRVEAASVDGWTGGLFEPPRVAPDFELAGSQEAPLTMSQLRGKVVILLFGFTYCPRVCPVTLARLVKVYEQLGDASADVQVLFISVDPERDSPSRLREFLSFFNPAFLGATGTPEQLQAVRKDYGIMASRVISENKKLGYEIHHSSFLYLIDRAGRLRVLMPFGKPPEDIVHDLRLLLRK